GTRAAGVSRFVHCGTEAALIAGEPLRSVDETVPLRPDSPAPYASTKARAEQAVRGANDAGFETVVIRPRFVWGAGDTTLLPSMVEMVKSGRFAWISGGTQLTDITHVDNVVEGLRLGARKGRGGQAYFVTACERLWRTARLPGRPPLTRFAYWISSQECTIDIAKARRELDYRPVKQRAEGLAELRAAAASG